MWRALDNVSIRLKVLITPALAILALALICGVSLRNYSAAREANGRVTEMVEHRLRQASHAKLVAASLQAMMFRFTTMGLMGAAHDRLVAMAEDITARDRALGEEIGRIAAETTDSVKAERLRATLSIYQTQSSNAAVNFLNNLGWGATTARNAALALDSVIDAVGSQEADERAAVDAARADEDRLMDAQRDQLLLILAVGSPAMMLFSMVIGHRIAAPIRRLTVTMTRLAAGRHDDVIPALDQRDEVGSMARAVRVFRDAMVRTDALTSAQHATQTFLDTVLEHVPSCIIVKNARDLRFLHINRAAELCLGVEREKLLGRNVAEVVPPAAAERIQALDMRALTTREMLIQDSEVIETIANGQRLAVVTRLAIPGPSGDVDYLLTMMEDVTDRRRAEQRVAYMARYDTLTDLPNRSLFAELLAQTLDEARRKGGNIAVLGLDLDHFKEVNDTLGHATGDGLLRGVAMRLRGCLRGGDLLARLAGDEFAVIQNRVRGLSDAESLAERLIEAAGQPFEVDGQKIFIGLSVGIALGGPSLGGSELVQQADLALYGAKQAGGGCYRAFAPEMYDDLQHRRRMETDFRAAIGTGQITLNYQPQVDIDSRRILGAEALMRWTVPGQGPVPPSVFIPMAEETGLIGPLGAWLLDVACAEAAQWPSHLRIAVNVSPIQLRLPGFLAAVKSALISSTLAPERLELEVTEGIFMQDSQATLEIFDELRALGIKLALDDFGTGYASLGYLQKFRFDKIKIDRSFVKGVEADPNARAIVRAVVELSKSLGIRTNAEGVETEEERALLRTLGCMEAQGYLFWRPMPAQAMRDAVAAEPNLPRPDLLAAPAAALS